MLLRLKSPLLPLFKQRTLKLIKSTLVSSSRASLASSNSAKCLLTTCCQSIGLKKMVGRHHKLFPTVQSRSKPLQPVFTMVLAATKTFPLLRIIKQRNYRPSASMIIFNLYRTHHNIWTCLSLIAKN